MKFASSIFKDYDVRGLYPEEINPEIFNLIAQEIALFFKPKVVAVGRDIRQSSQELSSAMIEGFFSSGINVVNLGLITTDMIYFAAGKYGFDLGIMITGSHVEGENGFKICKKGGAAISGATGLYQVRDRLLKRDKFPESKKAGKIIHKDILKDWVDHALSFIKIEEIRHFKIVVDAGNGMGGLVMLPIEKKLPGEFINLYFDLDGRFPNHFPNPLIEENLIDIRRKIKEVKADFGIAFDADGDRAFFLDENGKVISGSVLTAIIAKAFLQNRKKETILYNAVCGRIVPQTIKNSGGKGIRVRVGHSLIKEEMRKYNAIFAGEHSGHFYFRDNFYADSGSIAVLKTIELISKDNRKLSLIVKEFDKYPQSGEINFEVDDKEKIMKSLEKKYSNKSLSTDWLDGISVWFTDWWFNVRPSHTESLLRLNIEADNLHLLQEKTKELKNYLTKLGAHHVKK